MNIFYVINIRLSSFCVTCIRNARSNIQASALDQACQTRGPYLRHDKSLAFFLCLFLFKFYVKNTICMTIPDCRDDILYMAVVSDFCFHQNIYHDFRIINLILFNERRSMIK